MVDRDVPPVGVARHDLHGARTGAADGDRDRPGRGRQLLGAVEPEELTLVVHHRPAGEEPDAEYPLYFTTGRYKEHYNSGAQTRLVETLIDAKPEPRLQMHPRLAQRLGAADGDLVKVESRRGCGSFRVSVNAEIRPDTLFAPFHWGGRAAANILTNPALDPTSRMPEFKLCAVRATLEK